MIAETKPLQILILSCFLLFNCGIPRAGSADRGDQKTAHDFYLSGNVFCCSGQYDEAIAALRESVRLDPDYYYAQVNLGVALAKSQKFAEAIETFTFCINKKWGSQTDRFIFYFNRAIANDEAEDAKSAQRDRATLAKLDSARAGELANSKDYILMDAIYSEKRNEADKNRLFDKNMTSIAKGQVIVHKIDHGGKNAEEYEALGLIEGTLKEVSSVLSDYESYPKFMPNVNEIKIASSTQDATVVDYKLLLPMGVVKKYRLKFWSKKEEHRIQLFWKKLPWPDLKPEETVVDTYGQWIIEKSPQKDGPVLAYYRVYTDPGNIPLGMGWIVDILTQKSIPGIINGTRNRVKSGGSTNQVRN
jgi:hypothetical protein